MTEILLDWMHRFDSVLVAFSGGLDSSVVAKAAQSALGRTPEKKTLAITAYSASSCANEPEDAANVAREIGIAHILFPSREFEDPGYLRNDQDRCYHCKKVRFLEILRYARERNFEVVVDGSNADDQNDYRPGTRAAAECGVRSPLAELGMTKERIRSVAKRWGLSNWDLPAAPCLSTRIAYDIPLEDSLLRKVEAAETLLRSLGFSPVRVRVHEHELVRIELSLEQIPRFWERSIRRRVAGELESLGFGYVTVDLNGFRSGSMNLGLRRSESQQES